mmetsp:Transcript_11135/g.24848  ORF Transcript_11135/g.24848 Transcript_11135/m.24848 type:complete len:267 (-) Transcript_11135:1229-2029(-)
MAILSSSRTSWLDPRDPGTRGGLSPQPLQYTQVAALRSTRVGIASPGTGRVLTAQPLQDVHVTTRRSSSTSILAPGATPRTKPLQYLQMAMRGCLAARIARQEAEGIPRTQPLQHMQMPASGSIEADIIHPRALRTLGVHPLQRPQVPALGRAARTVRSPVNRRGAGSQPLQHVQMTPSRRSITQSTTPEAAFRLAQKLQHPQVAAACPLDRYPLPTRHTKLSPRPDVQLNRGQKVVNPEQCTRHRRKHIPAPPRHESELGVARGA